MDERQADKVRRALAAVDRLAPRTTEVKKAAVLEDDVVIALAELRYVQQSQEYEIRTIALLATRGVLRLGVAAKLTTYIKLFGIILHDPHTCRT